MKINITKKEYRTLLDVLFIAGWVQSAHEIETSEDNTEIHFLTQKIYSHAKEFGFDHLIQHFRETDEYEPSRQFEDETDAFELVRRYEDLSFWESLINKLTEREVMKRRSIDATKDLDLEEFYRLADPIETEFAKEFEIFGLERLSINKSTVPSGAK
jgi:hypothetical protein